MTIRNFKVNYLLSIFFSFKVPITLLKFSQHHSSLNTLCESSKCLIYALHVVRLWVNASTTLPAMSATDGCIECVGQVIFFSLFAPSFQHIYAFIITFCHAEYLLKFSFFAG